MQLQTNRGAGAPLLIVRDESHRSSLGGLLSSRARLRFTGCVHRAMKKFRRSSCFHRTATCGLTSCLSPGVHPRWPGRGLAAPLTLIKPTAPRQSRTCRRSGDSGGSTRRYRETKTAASITPSWDSSVRRMKRSRIKRRPAHAFWFAGATAQSEKPSSSISRSCNPQVLEQYPMPALAVEEQLLGSLALRNVDTTANEAEFAFKQEPLTGKQVRSPGRSLETKEASAVDSPVEKTSRMRSTTRLLSGFPEEIEN
jgi:hypothetical protein